jgi:hypothetical protein
MIPEMPLKWSNTIELKEKKEYVYNVLYKKALELLFQVDQESIITISEEKIKQTRQEIKEFLSRQ